MRGIDKRSRGEVSTRHPVSGQGARMENRVADRERGSAMQKRKRASKTKLMAVIEGLKERTEAGIRQNDQSTHSQH